MNVRRSDGYSGEGTRKHEGVKEYLPFVMTFLMFIMTSFVGALTFFYKEDRQNTRDLILQVSQTLSEFKKETDMKFAMNSAERTRVVENNELDKKEIRKEISDIKYQCCNYRRSN